MMVLTYLERKNLTNEEKLAISHYKDLINRQYKWDCNPRRRNRNVGIDCQMINDYLRGDIPEAALSPRDAKRLDFLVSCIDSAISKSHPPRELDLYKGVRMFPKLEMADVNTDINDGAFASFTTNLGKAIEYSMKNKRGEYIFYHIRITPKDSALYLDDDEDEWLLFRGDNTIIGIDNTKNFAGNCKAIVYHIKRTYR